MPAGIESEKARGGPVRPNSVGAASRPRPRRRLVDGSRPVRPVFRKRARGDADGVGRGAREPLERIEISIVPTLGASAGCRSSRPYTPRQCRSGRRRCKRILSTYCDGYLISRLSSAGISPIHHIGRFNPIGSGIVCCPVLSHGESP